MNVAIEGSGDRDLTALEQSRYEAGKLLASAALTPADLTKIALVWWYIDSEIPMCIDGLGEQL